MFPLTIFSTASASLSAMDCGWPDLCSAITIFRPFVLCLSQSLRHRSGTCLGRTPWLVSSPTIHCLHKPVPAVVTLRLMLALILSLPWFTNLICAFPFLMSYVLCLLDTVYFPSTLVRLLFGPCSDLVRSCFGIHPNKVRTRSERKRTESGTRVEQEWNKVPTWVYQEHMN